jgi:hypothetical protein
METRINRALTKRRAVLLDRVVTLCERCGSEALPIRVGRVLGYGSFFLGIDPPHDVDLFVVAGGRHPLFDRFESILDGEQFHERRDIATPERMKLIAAADPDPAVAAAADTFSGWLEGFSHRMLFHHRNAADAAFAHHPARFARRVLQARLGRINAEVGAADSMAPSRVVHEIWTPSCRDVRAAVERIWAADPRPDLLIEAESLEEPARALILEIAALRYIVNRLLSSRGKILRRHGDEVVSRYVDWIRTGRIRVPAELCEKVGRGRLEPGATRDLPFGPEYIAPSLATLDTMSLASAVEEKRKSLTPLSEQSSVLRKLAQCLDSCRRRLSMRDHGTLRRYLMERVPTTISKRTLSRKKVNAILTSELKRLRFPRG